MKKRILSMLLALALCLSLAETALAASEREPNGSAETATAISVNETVNATFTHTGSSGDTDWYVFSVREPGGVTLRFETPAEMRFYAQLCMPTSTGELQTVYSESFSAVTTAATPTVTRSSYTIYLAAGTCYLDMYANAYNDGDYSFRADFTARDAGTLEYQPNGDSQQASAIALDTSVAGSFIAWNDNGDTDWYSFTVREPGGVILRFETPAEVRFSATLYMPERSGELRLIYSESFSAVTTAATPTVTRSSYTIYLAAGTYYLNMYANRYNQGEYTFQADFTARSAGTLENQPNSGSLEATPVSLNTAVAGSFISWNDNGDTDWYSVTLPRSGSLYLSIQTPASVYFTATVYEVCADGSLESIAHEYVTDSSSQAGTTKTTVTDSLYLDAGTYYIRLYASRYNDGEYSFQAYTDAVSVPTDWAREQVYAAIDAGLVPDSLQTGYTDPVTRGEVAEMFIRLIEACAGKSIEAVMADEGVRIDYDAFTDTRDESVLAAHALGIIYGVGDGRFDPNGTLTRSQIAAILNRIAALMGVRTSGYSHSFTDVTGHWVSGELGWPVHAGIIVGVGDNRFDPEGPLTTEQAIVIAYRALVALT